MLCRKLLPCRNTIAKKCRVKLFNAPRYSHKVSSQGKDQRKLYKPESIKISLGGIIFWVSISDQKIFKTPKAAAYVMKQIISPSNRIPLSHEERKREGGEVRRRR